MFVLLMRALVRSDSAAEVPVHFNGSSTLAFTHHVLMKLCARVHHHAGAGLGLFVPVKGKCNATEYKEIQ